MAPAAPARPPRPSPGSALVPPRVSIFSPASPPSRGDATCPTPASPIRQRAHLTPSERVRLVPAPRRPHLLREHAHLTRSERVRLVPAPRQLHPIRQQTHRDPNELGRVFPPPATPSSSPANPPHPNWARGLVPPPATPSPSPAGPGPHQLLRVKPGDRRGGRASSRGPRGRGCSSARHTGRADRRWLGSA